MFSKLLYAVSYKEFIPLCSKAVLNNKLDKKSLRQREEVDKEKLVKKDNLRKRAKEGKTFKNSGKENRKIRKKERKIKIRKRR